MTQEEIQRVKDACMKSALEICKKIMPLGWFYHHQEDIEKAIQETEIEP